MTIVVIVLIGLGVIFIASSLDDTPIITTFQKILAGQPIDWSGATGNLTQVAPIQGVAGTGKPGTQNASPAPAGGWFTPTPASGTGGAWAKYPVTQAHGVNGETGIDLGTPFHSTITALGGGRVVSASYGPWGGSVFVAVQHGAQVLYENYLHLDQIMVNVGQQLSPGSLIGLSGGENPGYPGGLHPAGTAYSSGPHTEFGVYTSPYITSGGALNPSNYYQFG